jgi:hypothetical protein
MIDSLVVCCQGKKIRREEEKMDSWLVSLAVFEHSDRIIGEKRENM